MNPTEQLLDSIELPGADGPIDWHALSIEDCHQLIRGVGQLIESKEAAVPTDGLLERSIALEETVRCLDPLKHRYAGLIQDAFRTPSLRDTLGLSEGKTPFRNAEDLLAKTHGIRAYEAAGRIRLAAAMTPVRSTQQRDDDVAVGETKYPRLGELQATGRIHPSKFASAMNMLDTIDDEAKHAGKDPTFRDQLRVAAEQDLAERIEHTTPEEFSRYVSRKKSDILGALNPPGSKFTTAQTQAMHGLWPKGPVRGNPDAYEWRLVTSAEGNEALKTLEGIINNPRNKTHDAEPPAAGDAASADQSAPDRRTRAKRTADALIDALSFALGRLEHTDLPGAGGNHAQLVIIADYPTLFQHMKDELRELFPDLNDARRQDILDRLAGRSQHEKPPDASAEENRGQVIRLHPKKLPSPAPDHQNGVSGTSPPCDDTAVLGFPPPKSTDLAEVVASGDLDSLQPRVGQGMHTPFIPPEVLLRLLCDVRVSPVTLTGERQVLSIGRAARQFPEHIRRALLARDRGCAAPGCHWPAAWCEAHHVEYWSAGGATGTDNGVMLCSHHHAAVHAKQLRIVREAGVFKFIHHPLIDPTQTPRQNHFWQH